MPSAAEGADGHRPHATPDGWNGILDPGERIVWQGRPDGGWHVTAGGIAATLFGAAFAGFALFWMVLAAAGGGYFWMFGLLHFAAGLSLACGGLIGPVWRRRHTWYTLTDRRAFVATDVPFMGRKLDSYPIGPDTPLTLRDGPLGTIDFATRTRSSRKRSSIQTIGFERLPDAPAVYRLMRGIQADRTSKDIS
ncbi:aspartate carbamoyltransferase catalytic subunit [Thalassococcus sp. BH17M4-6]|uniref:aspartate carbamoyltransferase catalytic subunit n=1 Tax=Thalassococcus sp. BH17M4-6 TaxID=3413148 RepID=UPI003BE04455